MVERKSDTFDVTGSNPVSYKKRCALICGCGEIGRHARFISIFLSKKGRHSEKFLGVSMKFIFCLFEILMKDKRKEIVYMRLDILERKSEILQWISEEQPKSFMCQQLQCKQETLNAYLKKMGIEYAGQQNKKGQQKGTNVYKPASFYFDNKQTISSHKLKVKLIKDGIKENKCEICGCSMWQGVMLPLELHHIDNNHNNNALENLQILCPNCHSIQEGNAGANIGKYAGITELA